MECSGSEATFFKYLKGQGPRPSRTQEGMILRASEWTGVPLEFEERSNRIETGWIIRQRGDQVQRDRKPQRVNSASPPAIGM
jgi:hypothetical protein